MDRPDLTGISDEIRAYIEHLEGRLLQSQIESNQGEKNESRRMSTAEVALPQESPTLQNVIVFSRGGLIKRTPRHLYSRQNRGGMGNFDIDLPEDDVAEKIAFCREDEDLIVLTNFSRIFRCPLSKIPVSDSVRAKGTLFRDYLDLHPKEEPIFLSAEEGAHLAILTAKGFVVTKNRHYLKQGAILYDTKELLAPIAACWSTGQDDLIVASKKGKAIRFSASQVPNRGVLGMRLDEGDELLGIAASDESGGVALMTGDGKGTIRLMAGFRKNKSPGAGGKVIIKSDDLISIEQVQSENDLFLISGQSKMIRFGAVDIPQKTGVVQGVNCMALRSDDVVAAAVCRLRD